MPPVEMPREIRDFTSLLAYLVENLKWDLDLESFTDPDDLTFEWSGESLRLGNKRTGQLSGGFVRQLRTITHGQPWGIFLVEFTDERIYRTALREILRGLVASRRRDSQLPSWQHENLLFVCATRDYERITFAHFRGEQMQKARLATFGWQRDSSYLRTLLEFNLPNLHWPEDPTDSPAWLKQWASAFDKEKMTGQYFRDLNAIYQEALVPDLRKSLKEDDKAKDAGLTLLNRLLFLYFVQKKGWLDGRGDYLVRAFGEHRANAKGASYYTRFLWPLFQALSMPKHDRSGGDFQNIPFLNGGLFEPQTTVADADLKVSNATFARMFDELLERYNFTVTEDTPLDVEVAVDPEMLGKVFEELVTGPHESGAYYTPRPVVSFMCKEALKGYLGGGKAVERFVDEQEASGLTNPEAVLEKLRDLKVCDPACGSGAYLVGMLQELMALRHALFAAHKVDSPSDYNRKLDIIQNNLYGVDIDPTAVSIARLRLWLTLCIEYEAEDGGEPLPLPNLDFKIEMGDSVTGPEPHCVQTDALTYSIIEEFETLKNRYSRENIYGDKRKLKERITLMRKEIGKLLHPDAAAAGFDWSVEIAEVMASRENPGFDIVLANPPFVRQELIRDLKPRLRELFPEFYSGTADLFTYFFARGFDLLRRNGQLVFICSSTWTKTAAAEKLRRFLRTRSTVHRFLDFGDLQVFEKTTTYPAIIIVEKQKPPQDHQIRAYQVRTIQSSELDGELRAPGILVPQRDLEDAGWRFEDRRIARLRQKIHDAGVPLKDYCGSPLYGIKTGLNEAFVIDRATRDALVAADPKCAEILKPYMEGRDLTPWRANWRGLWLIRIPAGWTNQDAKTAFKSEKEAFAFFRKRYPAVADYLATFAAKARKRCDKGDWYWELRPCAYYPEFENPKIMYPDITALPKFVFDDKGYYFGTTTFFLPNGDRFIQGLLCSTMLWWQLTSMVRLMRGGYLRLKTQYMETLPIASATPPERRGIAALAEALSAEECRNRPELQAELNDRVAALYSLTQEEKKIIGTRPGKQAREAPEEEDGEE